MNINQLKVYLSDKPKHLGSENSIQNQLRDDGLKQAINLQNNQTLQKMDQFSSSRSLGARVYSNALNNTLEIDRQKPDFSAPVSQESKASLFDFEKIAKNVINFVGGAIKNAQNRGADSSELNELFKQASSGVLRGIKLAERDLAGFLNEEITNGISQSKSLIEHGIANLKRDIFNPEDLKPKDPSQLLVKETGISYEKKESGRFSIRTRDGDDVNITFKDLQKFEYSQRQLLTGSESGPNTQSESNDKAVITEQVKNNAVSPSASKNLTPVTDMVEKSDVIVGQVEQVSDTRELAEPKSSIEVTLQNTVFYQENSFSFTVNGELDENELKAIGRLVADANELAGEFFNGNIESAFNQALELGFDEQELSSFALQLKKIENTQIIKVYENVSRFDADSVDSDPAKAVKPVAGYLNKLLNVLDGSKLQLEDNKSYENLINELVINLGEGVAKPDLISAINRFNEFNQKLVNNLPIGYQPKNNFSSGVNS
jgi:hypothetical protein